MAGLIAVCGVTSFGLYRKLIIDEQELR